MKDPATAQSMVAAATAAQHNLTLLAHIRNLYRRADALIAAHRPVCFQSGRCCQFARMQHSLFVTTAELAYFLHVTQLDRIEDLTQETCPFQHQGPVRCTARQGRPLGCRIFHCDPASQWWQQDLYNQLHGRLRQLHEQFALEYYYAEWLTVLRAAKASVLGAADRPDASSAL